MAPHLPSENWFLILSYNAPLDNWTTLRAVDRRLRDIVETDFAARCRSIITASRLSFHAPVNFIFARFSPSDPKIAIFEPRLVWGPLDRAQCARTLLKELETSALVTEMETCPAKKEQGWTRDNSISYELEVDGKWVRVGSNLVLVRWIRYTPQQVPLPGLTVDTEKLEISLQWMPMFAAVMLVDRKMSRKRLSFLRVK